MRTLFDIAEFDPDQRQVDQAFKRNQEEVFQKFAHW
jgi:hypothetical protein